MSDGVGNPLQWSHEVAETLAGWWARPPEPLAFAAQVGFARQGHMDDRTVVGIWAGEEDAGREEEPRGRSPGCLRAGSARFSGSAGITCPAIPADLAYKEFTQEAAVQAKSAAAAVAYRDGLSPFDKADLD